MTPGPNLLFLLLNRRDTLRSIARWTSCLLYTLLNALLVLHDKKSVKSLPPPDQNTTCFPHEQQSETEEHGQILPFCKRDPAQIFGCPLEILLEKDKTCFLLKLVFEDRCFWGQNVFFEDRLSLVRQEYSLWDQLRPKVPGGYLLSVFILKFGLNPNEKSQSQLESNC